MNPDVVQRFEKKYGCSVVMNHFGSTEAMYEMLTDRLKAGQTSGYDVMFPTSAMAKRMYEEGMLRSIDRSKLPNLKNIDMYFIKNSSDPAMNWLYGSEQVSSRADE